MTESQLSLSLLSMAATLWLACGLDDRPSAMGAATPFIGAAVADPDAPQIASLAPAQGPNSGGITLVLSGQNYTVGTRVWIGGAEATEVTVLSGTRITARLPANPTAYGPSTVTVRNPDGREQQQPDAFLYYAPLPLFPASLLSAGSTSLLLAGDVDADGKLDLVASSQNTVRTLRNDGSGGFPGLATTPVGTTPVAGVFADFDQDQRLDLAIVNRASNDVSILRGDGSGGWVLHSTVAVGSAPVAAALGDWNRDGSPDLAVANSGSGTVSILLGNGSGGFVKTRDVATGASPEALVVSDWNLDGNLDLASANRVGNSISLLSGNGSGDFVASTLPSPKPAPRQLAAADLNGDGQPDLAVTVITPEGGTSIIEISTLLASASGGFQPATAWLRLGKTEGGAEPLLLQDLDGDQRLDAIVAMTDKLWVLWGDGRGAFTSVTSCPAMGAGFTQAVVLADLNGDRIQDVAVASRIGVVFLPGAGHGGLVCPEPLPAAGSTPLVADFNGDQALDVLIGPALLGNARGNLVAIAPGFSGGYSTIAAADFDLDGRLDVAAHNSIAGLAVRLGDGQGGFAPPRVVDSGSTAPGEPVLAAADLNGDQIPDLITQRASALGLYLGDGTGAFPWSSSLFLPLTITGAVAADINQDGRVDLVASGNKGTSAGMLLLGDGRGGFSAPVALWPGGAANAIAAGDWDGDHVLDLAACGSGTVYIALGDGRGGTRSSNRLSGVFCNANASMRVGDWNGDGRDDVVLTSRSIVSTDYVLTLLVGAEVTGLRRLMLLSGGSSPGVATAAVAADLNGSRRPHIAIGGVSVLYRNQVQP